MKQLTIFLIVLVLIAAAWLNCDNEPSGPSEGSGYIIVHLTDAPAQFDEVNITFSEVSFHLDSRWVSIRRQPITVNLLDWTNGKTMVLGEGEMPAGHYTQLRLKIDSGEIVTRGQTYSLTVPSGELKFGPQMTVARGATYELIVDFDVNRSIVRMGPPKNPAGYKLKPHIRVIPKALTGSISGTVTNPQHLPVAYAIQGSDTTTSAFINISNGFFMLAFLPGGNYTVAIQDTLDRSFSQNDVSVVVGGNNDIGEVTLQ